MRTIEKKAGLILGGIFLFSLVLVGVVMVQAEEASTGATVTVNEFLSVTLSNDPVIFPSMDPGAGPTSADGSNGFPLTATIGSETNVNVKVGTKADNADFSDGSNTFSVSNMEWDNTDISFVGTDYTTSNAQVCASVAPNSACTIYHKLTIPGNQAAGTYNVGITVSVVIAA